MNFIAGIFIPNFAHFNVDKIHLVCRLFLCEVALKKHPIRSSANGFRFCKIKPSTNKRPNAGNQLADINQPFFPEFCKQTKANLLIDFYQNLSRYLFHCRHCKFFPKFCTSALQDTVNSNTSQASINQSLHLIAPDIIPRQICRTGNHSHLYIKHTTNIGRYGHWQCNYTSEPIDDPRCCTFCNLHPDHLTSSICSGFIF